MTDLDALLRIAHTAIDDAADLIHTRPPGALTPKGERDYVSEVDVTVEQTVREHLRAKAPGIAFVGEEEHATPPGTTEWWTLDPIDGTVNFAHGLPLCAVSLGLVRDGRPVLGVIELPFLNARYWAVEGRGAHRDRTTLLVRDVDRLSDAVVAMGDYAVGAGAEAKNRARLSATEALAARALRVRMLGSAAIDLAWLAEGRIDASITLSNRSWDVAAGVILAREAGARVVDLDGREHTTDSVATIGASAQLLGELLPVVRSGVTEAPQP
jgi:myo-inositol-1(or 4)-monophosphatase